jgi:hypothetical protein
MEFCPRIAICAVKMNVQTLLMAVGSVTHMKIFVVYMIVLTTKMVVHTATFIVPADSIIEIGAPNL